MGKWHIIARAFMAASVISIVCLLINVFVFGSDAAGLNFLAEWQRLIQSLCFFVSPIVLVIQLIGCIIYGIVQKTSTDYTIRTLFYQLLALMFINLILVCIPGNNIFSSSIFS